MNLFKQIQQTDIAQINKINPSQPSSFRTGPVRIADRIMVLKEGSVLEIGTHEELMENDMLYAELFNLQAAGYQ